MQHTEALNTPKRWPMERYSTLVDKCQIVTAPLFSTEIDCHITVSFIFAPSRNWLQIYMNVSLPILKFSNQSFSSKVVITILFHHSELHCFVQRCRSTGCFAALTATSSIPKKCYFEELLSLEFEQSPSPCYPSHTTSPQSLCDRSSPYQCH